MKKINLIAHGVFMFTLFYASVVLATGPRVTQSMFETAENEIFAVDSPPYIGSDLDLGGVNTAIVKAALKAVDINTTVTMLPLAKMVQYYLLEEQALGVFNEKMIFSNRDKKGLIFVPILLTKENYYYLKNKQQSTPHSLTELAGWRYGTNTADSTTELEKHDIKVQFFRHGSLLDKLTAGEVDFIRLSEIKLNWIVDQHLSAKINLFSAIKAKPDLVLQSVAFNKKHAQGKSMAKKLKQGLLVILNNGQYAEILKSYLNNADEIKSRVQSLRSLLSS